MTMCYLRSRGHHAVSHLVYSGLTYHEPHPGLVRDAGERRSAVPWSRGIGGWLGTTKYKHGLVITPLWPRVTQEKSLVSAPCSKFLISVEFSRSIR